MKKGKKKNHQNNQELLRVLGGLLISQFMEITKIQQIYKLNTLYLFLTNKSKL